MKAIVAEIDKKQMIVITDKGDFVKVKRQLSAAIGDEIELKPQKTNLTYRRLAGMAACLLMCVFFSTGVYAYYTPYSYVSVDINPSIALSLNRFEKVISVNPLNEDAVSLLKNTKNLKNQDIDEALSEIIKSASIKGYIDAKVENQIMVVVSTKNSRKEDKLASTVNTTAVKELSKVNSNYGVTVEKTNVLSYKTALSDKVSPGKKILAEKLRKVIPEIKDEEIRNMSVKEAVHLIKEGKKAVKGAEKAIKAAGKDSQEKGKEKDKKAKPSASSNGNNYKKNAAETSIDEGIGRNIESSIDEEDSENVEEKEKKEKKKDIIDEDNENKNEDKGKNNNNGDLKGKANSNKKDSKGKNAEKGQGR